MKQFFNRNLIMCVCVMEGRYRTDDVDNKQQQHRMEPANSIIIIIIIVVEEEEDKCDDGRVHVCVCACMLWRCL